MFAAKDINFTFYRIKPATDLMLKVMRENYDSAARRLNVVDLIEAIQNQSEAQLSQTFTQATSFILRDTLGGGAGGANNNSGKAGKKAGPKQEPLWDTKQFAVG